MTVTVRTAHLDPKDHLPVWHLSPFPRRRGPISRRNRRHTGTYQMRVVMRRGKVVPCLMARAHFKAFKLMSDERNVGQKIIP